MSTPSASQSLDPVVTLLTFPGEIRNRILKDLLVDPILGEMASISSVSYNDSATPYSLAPEILRANRQFYKEGSAILYGYNTFIIECVRDHEGDRTGDHWDPFKPPYLNISPLTRHLNALSIVDGSYVDLPSIHDLRCIRKVKKWRVVLNDTVYTTNGLMIPPKALTRFCRIIRKSSVQSLEVSIIPPGILPSPSRHTSWNKTSLLLLPLQVLRNVGKLEVVETPAGNIPTGWLGSLPNAHAHSQVDLSDGVGTLRSLIMGSNPVEYPHKMYGKLLSYAQIFERCDDFKADMNMRSLGPLRDFDPSRASLQTGLPWTARTRQRVPYNPFKAAYNFEEGHPVEMGLEEAKNAIEDDGHPYGSMERTMCALN